MADKKISQLTALSAANLAPSTDVLAIVDTSATETKKIVAQDLVNGVLNVASSVGIGTTSPQRPLHVFYNNAAVGAYTTILQGAQGGYGAGISFQSVLQGSSTLAEMCRITADGESAWSTTASTQDANLRFYTAIDGTVAERMRLTAGGLLSLWDVNGDKFQLNGLASNSYKLSKLAGGGQYGDGEFRITAGDTLAGAVTFSSGGTTRAIIDNAGNFGIGTASPATKLHVYSGSGATSLKVQRTTVPTYLTDCATGASNAASVWSVNIQNTSNGSSSWASPDNTVYSCAAITLDSPTTGSNILFSTASAVNTAPTERGRFTAGGVLCINSTSNVGSEITLFKQTAGAGSPVTRTWNNSTSGNNEFVEFATESSYTARGSITYNRAGGLVAYNTTSDYRAKDVYGLLDDSGEVIDALKVYRGKMHGATMERPMLIAHEAQEVAPYAVTGEKDAVNDDGDPVYQQMDASSLVPLLLAEIQSLRSRVSALEAK